MFKFAVAWVRHGLYPALCWAPKGRGSRALLRQGLAAIGGALLLLASSGPAESQTFVDHRKPEFVGSLSVPPADWYDSVEEAFAAHKAYREANNCGSTVIGRTCTISDLKACDNNTGFNWGVAGSWC